MKPVVAWLMSGRFNAIVVAAGLGILPVLHVFSAGIVALVSLRMGVLEGLLTLAGAGMLLGGMGAVMGTGAMQAVTPVLSLWLLALGLAWQLRRTGLLPLMVQTATLLAVIGVLVFLLGSENPLELWKAFLEEAFAPVFAQLGNGGGFTDEQLTAMARLMTGLVGAMLVLLSTLAVMIGRWWQGMLDNPGGFGRDFRAYRNGGLATLIASAIFVLSALVDHLVLANLAVVILVLFLYQGLAVVHHTIRERRMNTAWLIALYVLMLPMPLHVSGLVMALGLMDGFFDFRARLRRVK